MKCRWWNRWWHRRLRRLDRRYLLSSLWSAADKYNHGDFETQKKFVSAAWERFTKDAGQEHWLCECAREEGIEHAP